MKKINFLEKVVCGALFFLLGSGIAYAERNFREFIMPNGRKYKVEAEDTAYGDKFKVAFNIYQGNLGVRLTGEGLNMDGTLQPFLKFPPWLVERELKRADDNSDGTIEMKEAKDYLYSAIIGRLSEKNSVKKLAKTFQITEEEIRKRVEEYNKVLGIIK